MIIKEDPRSFSEQRYQYQSRLKIKAAIIAVLTPAEGVVLAEALDRLAAMPLNAAPRWRVGQIEHVLCDKDTARGMDEP